MNINIIAAGLCAISSYNRLTNNVKILSIKADENLNSIEIYGIVDKPSNKKGKLVRIRYFFDSGAVKISYPKNIDSKYTS